MVVNKFPLRTSTPTSNVHPEKLALQHLYLNRLIEGYDAPCDSIFTAWKTLYNDWELIKEQIEIDSFGSRSSLSDDVNPIISGNLKYPSVQRNSKPAQKKA